MVINACKLVNVSHEDHLTWTKEELGLPQSIELRLPSSSLVQVGGKQERFFCRLGLQGTTATACKVAWIQAMRRGELLGLHWQDIDFKTRSLHVRRTVNRIGKFGLVESEPKTQRSRRKITLPVFVIDLLKQHQEHQKEMREKAGSHWRETGVVFCNLYGGYYEPSNLHDAYKKLLKSAGLPDIRFHDLRHSAATILLGMGVHPKIVQELLGHSSISITMDVYSHVLPSIQLEAMDKLDDLFKGNE